MRMKKMVKKDSIQFVFSLPFIGVFVSLIVASIAIFTCRPWSVYNIIYIFAPTVFGGILYCILKIVLGYSLDAKIQNRKRKRILLIGIVLLLSVNILYWKIRSVEFTNITLKQLEKIENADYKLNSYYVIYSTENCVYCHQMEPLYKKAFLKENNTEVYIVDLSNERTDGREVLKKEISRLPVLVHYKDGKEIARMEGVSTMEMLVSFID